MQCLQHAPHDNNTSSDAQDQLIVAQRLRISSNHDRVVDQIKAATDELIAQLQEREDVLLRTVNQLAKVQLNEINRCTSTIDVDNQSGELSAEHIHFVAPDLRALLNGLASFGRVFTSVNLSEAEWCQESVDQDPLSPTSLSSSALSSSPQQQQNTDENEQTLSSVRGLLNKLTAANYERVARQIAAVQLLERANEHVQRGIAQLFVKSALGQNTLIDQLVQLVVDINKNENNRISLHHAKFRVHFLNELRDTFRDSFPTAMQPHRQDESAGVLRHRGNVAENINLARLISEMYNRGVLAGNVVLNCVALLLLPLSSRYDKGNIGMTEANRRVDMAIQLLMRAGARLDAEHSNTDLTVLETHCSIIEDLCSNAGLRLSNRVKFMAQDLIELRYNKWQKKMRSAAHTDSNAERPSDSIDENNSNSNSSCTNIRLLRINSLQK